jgi:hypothetical protein
MNRHRSKHATFNISTIQDFVLNERNIENILIHTIIPALSNPIKEKPQIKKETVHSEQFLLPRFNDTLFWCYYIIKNGMSNYEMVHSDGFKDSSEIKIGLVYTVREHKELLKLNKWKKNIIEDELANQKTISITTFMCICAISNINIVYIDGRKVYTLMNNEDTQCNIIEKTSHGYSVFIGDDEEKNKKRQECIENLWQIDNLKKPLRGISTYKAKELQNICGKLQIDILSDKKMPKKKSILYKLIREYL